MPKNTNCVVKMCYVGSGKRPISGVSIEIRPKIQQSTCESLVLFFEVVCYDYSKPAHCQRFFPDASVSFHRKY